MQFLSVFKNASYQTIARILTSGSGFIISVLLARHLGTYDFGNYIKIISFISIFYLVSDFGINAVFLQREKEEEIRFKDLLYLRLSISVLLFILANLISLFLPWSSTSSVGFSPFVKLGIFIFSWEFFIQAVLFSTNAIFQKRLRFDFWTKSLGLGSALSVLLIILAVLNGYSLQIILLFLVISDLVSALLSLFYAKEKFMPFDFNFKKAKELIVVSFPLGMMLVFNLIYFRVDILILAAFKASADVGIYGVSYLFFDFLLSLPLFISNALYPILLKHRQEKEKFLNLVRSYFLTYLVFSFIVVAVFWFSSPLFSFVKPEFSQAIVPFRILLLALPFFFLTSFLQWVLITAQKLKFLMLIYFFSMCANIILNFIFIPRYSYIAAAGITGICEAGVFLFLMARVIKLKNE